MPRLNVWVPKELASTVAEQLPDVNVSKVLQEGLQRLLSCKHATVICALCAVEIDVKQLVDQGKVQLATQLKWEFEDLIGQGGTAEGAGRILVSVAKAHELPGYWHQPRPSKAQRRRAEEQRWLEQQRNAS